MVTRFDQLDVSKQYTYADYLTWQFAERVELIKGWIYKMSPAPSRKHQRISARLSSEIDFFLKQKPCHMYVAPFDVRMNNNIQATDDKVTTVVQPDICVICDLSKLDEKGCNGAPDLIVEIISKTNSKRDIDTKFKLYESNQVQEYWIVAPEDETVSVFDLINDKYVLRRMYSNEDEININVIPGCTIKLNEVFVF